MLAGTEGYQMIVVLSLLGALQATPANTEAVLAAAEDMRACVDRQVDYLERSGEAAGTIAEVAKISCEGERARVAMHAAERGSTPEGGQRIADRVLAELDEQVRTRALLRVTQIRADRNQR